MRRDWVRPARFGVDVPPSAISGWLYRIGFYSLLAFIFTIPWEDLTMVRGAGTLSKMVGGAASVVALLGILEAGRCRSHTFFWVALLFGAWSWASFFWSISPSVTLSRDITYLELWFSAWLLYQYADSGRAVRAMLAAYVFGSVVTSVVLLRGFVTGAALSYSGYTEGAFNPNVLAYYVALAATMGWYLGDTAERVLAKTVFWVISGLSVVTVILTASRGGLIILGLGAAYAVISARGMRPAAKLTALAILSVAVWVALSLAPAHVLDRLSTIESQLSGGTLDLRTVIWRAGLAEFPGHLLLGTGAATFPMAISHGLGMQLDAHNVFVQVLVETGLLGLVVWLLSLGAATYWLLSSRRRSGNWFWVLLGLQVVLCLGTANFEWRKVVWLALALLAAQGRLAAERPSGSTADAETRGTAVAPLQDAAW